MKLSIVKIIVFVSICSVLSACTASQQAGSNGVSKNQSAPKTGDGKTSAYPPLATSLADAELELLDGSKTKISDRKGKVLLLNIWGIWCGPCRAEMPHLVELQEKYGEKGLEIVGLNIGDQNLAPENVDAIKVFSEKMKLNYTIVRSPRPTTEQFYKVTKQQVVPQTLLVDREGHLRGVFVGGGERVINSMKENVEKAMSE